MIWGEEEGRESARSHAQTDHTLVCGGRTSRRLAVCRIQLHVYAEIEGMRLGSWQRTRVLALPASSVLHFFCQQRAQSAPRDVGSSRTSIQWVGAKSS